MNITVNSAETEISTLTDDYLPHLQKAAAAISADWALWESRPQTTVDQPAPAVSPRS
jgi:IclR family pca regulon transcriptional regulator